MPVETISSSSDTVGVAVVNYLVPIFETKEQVISNFISNCHNIAAYIDGVKKGYPGLDLIIFPE
jgi:amidase